MLVRFSGVNARSFRDSFEVSLLSTSMSEPEAVRTVSWRDGEGPNSQIGVLPVAAFFGANASGKSNVLRVLNDMRSVVLNSFREWTTAGRTHRHPFRLDAKSRLEPTRYEIDLILEGVLHRYGFALDDERILEEWAFRFPKGRLQKIFERRGDDLDIGTTTARSIGQAKGLVRPNALFLSTVVALRADELRPLFDWFERNLLFADEGNRNVRQYFTARQLGDETRRERALALLRAADLGIVAIEEADYGKLPEEIKDKLETVLRLFSDDDEEVSVSDLPHPIALVHEGADGSKVLFDPSDESLGTTVWLGLVGPIIDALDNGSVLLADELDASLHPVLVEQIVRLFQSTDTNPRRAQLIFNSHDANLLGDSQPGRILGRDQIWFAEKDRYGVSAVYPLSDLNPRKQEAIGRRYLAGRYGAVPIVTQADFEDAARWATVE